MELFLLFMLLLSICSQLRADQAPRSEVVTVPVSTEDGSDVEVQNNYGGWVNPEDLPSMPQCIAQQDPSLWLDTMTRCTSKVCTRHFGIICTHHQWLTRLDCLSTEFTPEVISKYYPLCSGSILAKAQLYSWVQQITARRWLVKPGDANGLGTISPASLIRGYANMDVASIAPQCLQSASISPVLGTFDNALAVCSFTGATRHTGNMARPWEYNEGLHSMTALDYETAGYDLTHRYIFDNDYFDKECLCNALSTDPRDETCPNGPRDLDLTKKYLWINGTCGPRSLPKDWNTGLKTTEYAFIPSQEFHWPRCAADLPRSVMELSDRCPKSACDTDANGYCEVVPAIERACICQDIDYFSARGSCHEFEGRIDYINWLHDLCGAEREWHGLPQNWRALAVPTASDMIPWKWSLKPVYHLENTTPEDKTRAGEEEEEEDEGEDTGSSFTAHIFAIALINLVPLLALTFLHARPLHKKSLKPLVHLLPQHWSTKALFMAALHLCTTFLNALIVQATPGYEHTPVAQLVLLWCTLPRFTWLPVFLPLAQTVENINFTAAAGCLGAEIILLAAGAYYMLTTVLYGFQHTFYYTSQFSQVENGGWARMMYSFALLWVIIITWGVCRGVSGFDQIMRVCHGDGNLVREQIQRVKEEWEDKCLWVDAQIVEYWAETRVERGEREPLNGDGTFYGTLPESQKIEPGPLVVSVSLYGPVVAALCGAWLTQWLFWIGFVGISGDEFYPPHLAILTFFWASQAAIGMLVSQV